MNALSRQIDGSHYKNMKLQPIKLGYMLGETPCFVKVAKYTTRIKDNPIIQLEKAKHCIELEIELKAYLDKYNKLCIEEAQALIFQFTEDPTLRNVLFEMHKGRYEESLVYMNIFIERMTLISKR